MNNDLVALFGIVFAVGLPIVTVLVLGYRNQVSKHAERMAMIEKGIVIEEPERKVSKFNALRNGLLMAGLALGAIGGLFVRKLFLSWEADFMVFIMALLGGGIGFMVYFFLARKIEKKDKEEEMGKA